MADILNTNKKILDGLLYLNIIFLVVSAFYISKSVAITFFIVNIILIGTHLIIRKNYLLFQGISATNKLLKNIENMGST